MKKYYYILFLSFLLMIACKKDDAVLSRTELVAKTWRPGQISINGAIENNSMYTSYRWQFKTDGTYQFTLAPGQVMTGSWQLINDEHILLLDSGTPLEKQAAILQLTTNNFDWEQVTQDYKQGNITLELKLVPANN